MFCERSHSFIFFHSTSVKHRRTQVLVGCLGNAHMTILSATLVRGGDGKPSKGKSHKDPVVNLIECDESQKPRLERGKKRAVHSGANIVLLSDHAS